MAKQKNIFEEASSHERSTTRGIKVPTDFAQSIIEKFNEIGNFKLSVAHVNEVLGIEHDKHRAPAVRKQLNNVHANAVLLPEGMEYYVGTTAKDTYYVFGLREKTEE